MAILVARDESKRPLTHDIPPTNAVMRQPNRSTNDPVNGPRENIKANPTEPTQAGREQNSLNHCAVTFRGTVTPVLCDPLLLGHPVLSGHLQ